VVDGETGVTIGGRVQGFNSVLKAELIALYVAIVNTTIPNSIVLTDSKSCINLIRLTKNLTSNSNKWNKIPCRSIVRDVLSILNERQVQIIHVKAHTINTDLHSRLNHRADQTAKQAHTKPTICRIVEHWHQTDETFIMQNNTLIETNIRKYTYKITRAKTNRIFRDTHMDYPCYNDNIWSASCDLMRQRGASLLDYIPFTLKLWVGKLFTDDCKNYEQIISRKCLCQEHESPFHIFSQCILFQAQRVQKHTETCKYLSHRLHSAYHKIRKQWFSLWRKLSDQERYLLEHGLILWRLFTFIQHKCNNEQKRFRKITQGVQKIFIKSNHETWKKYNQLRVSNLKSSHQKKSVKSIGTQGERR
jgi:ribonuclease HI